MTEPTPRVLLAGLPAKMVQDPEFVIEGIDARPVGSFVPESHRAFVREVIPGLGLRYVGYTQIFRGSAATEADIPAVRERMEIHLRRALNWGIQAGRQEGTPYRRSTGGLEFLEQYVGAPIDPAFCRLAILRPWEVTHVPRHDPTPEDRAKAAEYGVELVGSPEHYELLCEVGLDLLPRRGRVG